MSRRDSQGISLFSTSFLDVLANTIGGLAFLLILALLLAGELVILPLEITTKQLPNGYDNSEYNLWLAARGGSGKYLWTFGDGQRPEGLVLESETGNLHGIPHMPQNASEKNKYDFQIICTSVNPSDPNKSANVRRNFEFFVYRNMPIDSIPLQILTDANLPDAYCRQFYPFQFAAEGGQPPYQWSISGNCPQGLEFTPGGQLRGRPTQTGEYSFDVEVLTPKGERKSKRFKIAVNEKYPPPPPLKVITAKIPPAVAKYDYTVYPAAEGGTPPYSWSIQSNKPGWLNNVDGSPVFYGKPALTDVGKTTVTWQVTDKDGQVATGGPVELLVLSPPGPPAAPLRIKTKSLPDGRAGQPYDLALAVEGGVPPYKWSFKLSRSCPGLSFSNEQGLISGSPVSKGKYSVSASVSDSEEHSASVDLELVIHPALRAVEILTEPNTLGRVGSRYSLAMSARGGYPPYTWDAIEGTLPEGLSLDVNSGIISGTPASAGPFRVKLNVKDAEGNTSANSLDLTGDILTERNARRLVITTKTLPVFLVGNSTEVTLACEGGIGPYQWKCAGSLPDGLRLEEASIRGAAAKSGYYDVKLSVYDSVGENASQQVRITVKRVVPFWLAALAFALLGLLIIMLLWLARAYAKRSPVKTVPLQILTKSIPNARASCDYSVQLACAGGEPPYKWRLAGGELPAGMKLEPDGKLYGRPFSTVRVNETIEVNFVVEVRDNRGNRATQKL